MPFLSVQAFAYPLVRSGLNRKSGSGRGGSLLAGHEPASPALVLIRDSITAIRRNCYEICVGKNVAV